MNRDVALELEFDIDDNRTDVRAAVWIYCSRRRRHFG